MSLLRKISNPTITSVVLSNIIIFVIGFLYYISTSNETLYKNVKNYNTEIVDKANSYINSILLQHKILSLDMFIYNKLKTLSKEELLPSDEEYSYVMKYLSEISKYSNGLILDIGFFNAKGKVLFSDLSLKVKGIDISSRLYYKQIRSRPNGMYIQNYMVSLLDKNISFAIARGIVDEDNKLIGGLVITYSLSNLMNLLYNSTNVKRYNFVVSTNQKEIIYVSSDKFIETNIYREFIKTFNYTSYSKNKNNFDEINVTDLVKETKWYITVLYDKSNYNLDIFKLILSVVFLYSISTYITYRIIKRISGLITKDIAVNVKIIQKMAEGEFYINKNRQTVSGIEEVDNILLNLRQTKLKIKKTISDLRSLEDVLENSFNTLSSDTQKLIKFSASQSGIVDRIANVTSAILGHFQSSSKDTKALQEISKNSSELLSKSINASKDTLNNIKKVSQKAILIQEITQNTNLLALNAAIEASKAGESGKGFAVVATEVRQLAQNSAKLSEEIKQLVADSLDSSQSSNVLVNNTMTEMKKINDIIAKVSSNIETEYKKISTLEEDVVNSVNIYNELNLLYEKMETSSDELINNFSLFNQSVKFFKIDKGDSLKNEDI